MLNQLLETIIQILTGWLNKFDSHAQHVEDKLDSLDQTASDIETNTEPISDIADNTGAVITPIQNIKSNTDSIKQSSQTSANNTTAILNNVSTLSTNTGRAAAFAEDCANNTLDIKDKVTTIASDTTQLRADSSNIAADVSSINQAIGYYVANTPVTEDSEGNICSFNTDLEDYLQNLKVIIPADQTGFSGITLTKCGKNLFNSTLLLDQSSWNNIPIKVKPNTIYIMSTNKGTPSNTGLALYFNNTNIAGGSSSNVVFSGQPIAIRSTSEGYVYVSQRRISGNDSFSNYQYQIEEGYIVTEFEAYKAMTYPVSFGTTITDGAEINLLDGIIKINSTPASYQSISPIAVRTYNGVNNIYSDIGTSALTYRETLKHYLAKNNQ